MKTLLKKAALIAAFFFAFTSLLMAADSESDFFYELNADGSGLVITGYLGNKPNISIPDKIQGFDVTEIGECAFAGTSIKSVYIPDSIVVIRRAAFAGNRVLNNINIPKSVTTIEAYAFCNTDSLPQVLIPNSVVSIGENAFMSSGITEIAFPDKLEVIPKNCCFNCKNLKKIKYSKALQTVQAGAFAYCSSFTDLLIPSSIGTIAYPADSLENGAFYMCNNAGLSMKKRQAIKGTGYKGSF